MTAILSRPQCVKGPVITGVSLVKSVSDSFITFAIAVLCVIACYKCRMYNDTQLRDVLVLGFSK